MSKSVFDIQHQHGKQMYVIGLEHAINMFELLGEDALPKLKEKLAKEKEELENE